MHTLLSGIQSWQANPMPYVSDGNEKMSLPTWSLPCKATCPGSTALCRSTCYARKAEVAYPDCLPSRARNYAASMDDNFVDRMVEIIAGKACSFFRIHESGDFYSQSYLEKWFAIARQLPDVHFLAFTKSFSLDFSGCPSNLQLVWSIYPDTDLSTVPAGPRAYAGKFTPRRETVECPGGCDACGMCWAIRTINADVHFAMH